MNWKEEVKEAWQAAENQVRGDVSGFYNRAVLGVVGNIIYSVDGYGIGVLCGSNVAEWKNLVRYVDSYRDLIVKCQWSTPDISWANVTDVDICYFDCDNKTMNEEYLNGILQEHKMVVLENAGWVYIQYLELLKTMCKEKTSVILLAFDGVFLSDLQWNSLASTHWSRSGLLTPNTDVYNLVYAEVDGHTTIDENLSFLRKYKNQVYPLHDHSKIPWDVIPKDLRSELRFNVPEKDSVAHWVGVSGPNDHYSTDMDEKYDCHVLREKLFTFCTKLHNCDNRPECLRYPMLAVVQSKVHAPQGNYQLGVIPLQDVEEQDFICEMKGKICERQTQYSIEISGKIVDLKGVGALVNHQCKGKKQEPLCRCIQVSDPEHQTERCFLVANRKIKAGEELTWDYREKKGFTCSNPDCCGNELPLLLPQGNSSPWDNELHDPDISQLITGLL